MIAASTDHQNQTLLLDPIALLTEELKDKNMKKLAFEEIGTIALLLSPLRIRSELVPLLIKTFIQQNLEIRVAIIKSLSILLEYMHSGNNSFPILEFILDILCAFSEDDIRREAYLTLEKVMETLDIRVFQRQLIRVIGELSKQSERNIRELVLKLIRYVYMVVESENENYLIELVRQYKAKEEDQLLLAQEISQFIKIMPPFPESEIHSIMKHLLDSPFPKVRSKLVGPVILLAKVLDHHVADQYFQILLKDQSTEVMAALIAQVKDIGELGSDKVLKQLLLLIDTHEKHDNTVRIAILEVLQLIPLTESRRNYILSANNFKSLSLSKALADSLCKIHDIEALSFLIDNSDTQFKNKLFPKLPPACEIHIKLMDHIFNQKNWRSKLTLLQNIEKRTENEQNVQIFIPKLLEQLGDRIGVLRMNVVKLLSLIIKSRKIQIKEISKQLNQAISSKNWFERQSVYILLDELSAEYFNLSGQDKTIIKSYIIQGVLSSIQNIKKLAQSIKYKCKIND